MHACVCAFLSSMSACTCRRLFLGSPGHVDKTDVLHVDPSSSEDEGKDLRALAFGICVGHTCQHVLA